MPNRKIHLVLLDCIALNQSKSTNCITFKTAQSTRFSFSRWLGRILQNKMLQKVAIPPPPSSLAIFWSRAFDSVTNILCPARAIALKISSCHKTDNNNTIYKIAQHRQQILWYSNQILILSIWWSLWRLIISPDLGMWRTEKMMTVDRRTQARWHSLQFLWLRLDLKDVAADCFLWINCTSVETLKLIDWLYYVKGVL